MPHSAQSTGLSMHEESGVYPRRKRTARQNVHRNAVLRKQTGTELPTVCNFLQTPEGAVEQFTTRQGLRPTSSLVRAAWRRERDSNPRYGFPYIGFQDRLFQPLTHPSARGVISADLLSVSLQQGVGIARKSTRYGVSPNALE